MTTYASRAETLSQRIFELIPDHQEILTLDSPFDLFKVDGFQCGDLEPSLAQAAAALAKARTRWKRGER